MLKTAGYRFATVAECNGMPAYNCESPSLLFERIRIRRDFADAIVIFIGRGLPRKRDVSPNSDFLQLESFQLIFP